MRRVGEMTYDNAEDYLVRAQEAANFFDNAGRKEAMKQFLDDKIFQAGPWPLRQVEAIARKDDGGSSAPRRPTIC